MNGIPGKRDLFSRNFSQKSISAIPENFFVNNAGNTRTV